MDFTLTEEQEKLAKEVGDYIVNKLPSDYARSVTDPSEDMDAYWMGWQKDLSAKGWFTPGWPKELGGLGLDPITAGVIRGGVSYWGVRTLNGIGTSIAGPAVVLFGTDEQKKRVIPPVIRGESIWWQLFTEPEAGSDESNIQMRAVPDGDHYVINGQKCFITAFGKPTYFYTLVRTAETTPKHRGLSLFLIPADTPGITWHRRCDLGNFPDAEIFFDNVRVHKDCLLGQLNRGFYHAMQTLVFERGGAGSVSRRDRDIEEFVQFCKEEKRNGKALWEDPDVRDKVADLVCDSEIRRLGMLRSAWQGTVEKRQEPSLGAYWTKRVGFKTPDVMMKIMGLYGILKSGSKWNKLAGGVERQWQRGRTIHWTGTFEIVRMVIARELGLPRIPAELMKAIGDAIKGEAKGA